MNRYKGYAKMWFLVLLLVAFVVGCRSSSSDDNGGVVVVPDTTAPTVSSTIPLDLAAAVATNVAVNANFSEEMDPTTVTLTTFTLKQGATAVAGAVTYLGTTAIFTPTSVLANSTLYTATITTGVKDLAGNAMAADYTFTFTTGTAASTTVPAVHFTIPVDLAVDVPLNTTVNATFSEVMSAGTLNASTFVVTLPTGSVVPGAVTYVGKTATFKPTSNLASTTTYTTTITTGAKDQAGTALAANYVWSFTTGTTADTTAPTVDSTLPLSNATGVVLNSTVSAIFSEPMSAATLTTGSFTVKQGSTAVLGTVNYLGRTVTFNPATLLASGATYTATITTGVTDVVGNAMAAEKVWSFTTGTSLAAGPAPVVLGSSGNYAILAKTEITTTGTTAVTGDIGVSPSAATYIKGFSLTLDPATGCFSTTTPGTLVSGHVFAADYNTGGCTTPALLTTAVLDMMTAYTDAAGRAPDYTELGAGNIGGMTLYPGTYKWSSGVLISSDVFLSGGANDVWIFEIAGDITQASATTVHLAGGALAKNIFWQVAGGTGVAIGTTAHFEGIILAVKAITLNTGASVNGRLLAQTAVTLNANAVVQPAP